MLLVVILASCVRFFKSATLTPSYPTPPFLVPYNESIVGLFHSDSQTVSLHIFISQK